METATGAPISGATVAFDGQSPLATDATGAWQLTGTGFLDAQQSVTVSAPGHITRRTSVGWQFAGRQNVRLDIIAERAPFSLTFYRQLARNGFEEPDKLRATTPWAWTTTPNFYINTFNPKTGQALEAGELAQMIAAIRAAVPQVTGNRLSAGIIDSGNGPREARTDYINVKFTYEPKADYCGRAFVGINPGEVTINYDRCARSCGSLKIAPEVVVHEVGHALGFWHIAGKGVMNAELLERCGNLQFTDQERLHASIVYARPRGNLDIDSDPSTFSAVQSDASGAVICRVR